MRVWSEGILEDFVGQEDEDVCWNTVEPARVDNNCALRSREIVITTCSSPENSQGTGGALSMREVRRRTTYTHRSAIFFMKCGSPARSTYRLPCTAHALHDHVHRSSTCASPSKDATCRPAYTPHDIRSPDPIWAHHVDDYLGVLHGGLNVVIARKVDLHKLDRVVDAERPFEFLALGLRANTESEGELGTLRVVVKIACYEATGEPCEFRGICVSASERDALS